MSWSKGTQWIPIEIPTGGCGNFFEIFDVSDVFGRFGRFRRFSAVFRLFWAFSAVLGNQFLEYSVP